MVNIGSWERLDLRQRGVFGPFDDQLVVIRRIEKSGWHGEDYRVGSFFTEQGKAWFRENKGGTYDAAKWRRKYVMLWTPLPAARPKDDVLRGI